MKNKHTAYEECGLEKKLYLRYFHCNCQTAYLPLSFCQRHKKLDMKSLMIDDQLILCSDLGFNENLIN